MVTIYGNPSCPWCEKAKEVAEQYQMEFEYLDTDEPENLKSLKEALPDVKTIPQIFMHGRHIGGYQDFSREIEETMGNYGQHDF